MFSFFKRKAKPQIIVPPSMAFFEPDQYGDFQAAVEGYFQSKNIAFSWLDGAISVAANDFGFGELGLMNLAQRCKQAPKDAYADLVNGHFESMVRGSLFQNEFEAKSHDFEYAKKYVGVRIYPDDYFPESHKGYGDGQTNRSGHLCDDGP